MLNTLSLWLAFVAGLLYLRGITMAGKDELDAKIAELEQKTAADVQAVQTQVSNLQGVVTDLQDKLANVPGAPDLQPEIDRLSAVETELDALNPPASA